MTELTNNSIIITPDNANNNSDIVLFNEVCFSYGKKTNSPLVLNNFNMVVKKGSIFGLLGPSGTGKTTILNILLARFTIKSGTVLLFSESPYIDPTEKLLNIGYAPQEIGLYENLTIFDTIRFHGGLHGMDINLINNRYFGFCENFLKIPPSNTLIQNLSGGQKRRVSLAIALLHEPKLLLLDEPTVGQDPQVRKSIWQYLKSLSKSEGITTIITTHYIEEAILADSVGLLWKGNMLISGNPLELIRENNTSTLEELFLKLCSENGDNSENNCRDNCEHDRDICGHDRNTDHKEVVCSLPEEPRRNIFLYSFWAIVLKNITGFLRDKGILALALLIPVFQLILYLMAIGVEPTGLTISVVNFDDPVFLNGEQVSLADEMIQNMIDNKVFKVEFVSSFEEGIDNVESIDSWGVIVFSSTFSSGFLSDFTGIQSPLTPYEATLDLSNVQISQTILKNLDEAFELAFFSITGTPYIKPGDLEEPVYGSLDLQYINFLVPGILVLIIFISSLFLTTMTMVGERVTKTLDRIYSAGTSRYALLFGYLFSYLLIFVVQLTLLLVITFFVFGIYFQGNIFLLFLILFLNGFLAMTVGIFLSASAKNEFQAQQLAVSLFFPIFLLSGVLWPIEGIPWTIRWICYIIPQYWIVDASRNIILRGNNSADSVFIALGFEIGFIILFTLLSIRSLRMTK